MSEVKAARWTPKPRQWPNGRKYWIASKGPLVLMGPNGDESRFDSKADAQLYCDEWNDKEPTQ
jgi:hypothetical protein